VNESVNAKTFGFVASTYHTSTSDSDTFIGRHAYRRPENQCLHNLERCCDEIGNAAAITLHRSGEHCLDNMLNTNSLWSPGSKNKSDRDILALEIWQVDNVVYGMYGRRLT
jgi:hypothetical protein